jgi:3-hydroxyisobutyrate dehydrogenase
MLYAQKAGLDVEKTLEVVSSGAAGSWSLTNYAPRMLKRNFDPGFFVEHFVKVRNASSFEFRRWDKMNLCFIVGLQDMEIALDEARRMELSLPGLALAHQLYVALKAQGDARKGTHALLLALERLNGIHNTK